MKKKQEISPGGTVGKNPFTGEPVRIPPKKPTVSFARCVANIIELGPEEVLLEAGYSRTRNTFHRVDDGWKNGLIRVVKWQRNGYSQEEATLCASVTSASYHRMVSSKPFPRNPASGEMAIKHYPAKSGALTLHPNPVYVQCWKLPVFAGSYAMPNGQTAQHMTEVLVNLVLPFLTQYRSGERLLKAR
ncbi:MAG: HU family DNA-binding protein, partial [bacterium]|nr:HU family DNA-binding protein [bacterium]